MKRFLACRFSLIIARVMPIPELNEHGLLPEGVHDCNLEEIGARFGRFQTSDRRVRLFENLRELIEEQSAGLAVAVIVDGSFVTDKPEPGDIDLVTVLPEAYNSSVELPPVRYNAVSRKFIRQRYRFDVYVDRENSRAYLEHVDLFQRVRESSARKGLLRIRL